jgi:hypothetical protein
MASKAAKMGELPFEELGLDGDSKPVPPRPQTNGDERPNSGGMPSAAPKPASPAPLVARRASRRFAGLSYAQLCTGALVLSAAIWAMWATNKIIALEDRRVVSVRLALIVNDYVAGEARSGTPPDRLEARTRAFMGALDAVLKKRAASGEVVLVGEAVIASSVPDVTNDVVADLSKIVRMPVAAALPPAIPSAPLPAMPAGPVAEPAPQSAQGSNSPFGEIVPPAELGPQQ